MGGANSASRSQGSSGSLHAVQVNDSVYELYKPTGTPSIQVVFVHGLQPGSYRDAHLSTWTCEDGSCVWPQTWLVEEFPAAHVFSVSFNRLLQSSSDSFDVYTFEENLISDLLMANIGQVSNCPLVLVGHSVGGLVINKLCYQVHQKLRLAKHHSETSKFQMFLENLRGIFYYATPQIGSLLGGRLLADMKGGPLVKYFRILNEDSGRMQYQFVHVLRTYNWYCVALGEHLPTKLGSFTEIVVPEASARCNVDMYYTVIADHFSICRPRSKTSLPFSALRNFLIHIATEMQEKLDMKASSLIRRAHQVIELLGTASVVGIVGMAGIGKTSLAKVIFNDISSKFEYTCFVDNVDGMKMPDLEDWVLRLFHRSGTKVDGNRIKWSDLKGRKTLIVLDGVESEDQIRLVPELNHFLKGSCLMITSRDAGIMKAFANCFIYDVDPLNDDEAKKLFIDYAFGQEGIPDVFMERTVEQVVQKCNGLPLSLKVLGSYIRGLKTKSIVRNDILEKLPYAEAVAGIGNEGLGPSLTVGYDALSAAEQAIFIEAGTYFHKQPIEVALAAWSTAYEYSETNWATLIGRSMVKELYKQEWDSSWQKLIEYKEVGVEKQLRDLANELSKGTLISRSVSEAERAVDRLNANEVHPNTTMLRLMCAGGRKLPLQLEMLGKLEKLKYLEVDGVMTNGSSKNFPRNISLLKWTSREKFQLFPVSLQHMNNLAVLELSGWVVSEDTLKAMGKLTNLRILTLSRNEGLHHLPDNLGNLSQLKRLELRNLNLTALPNSIGNISALEHLILAELELGELPESFGNLFSLEKLLIRGCHMLASLPDSIRSLSSLTEFSIHNCHGLECLQFPGLSGNLSSLAYLGLHDCPSLESLPANFGLLWSLEELVLDTCHQLKALPESFGQLKALKRLTICEAYHLEALPDSFGNLTTLKHLCLKKCWSLQRLPDSFGHLRALEELELEDCGQLHRFREDIGKLRALKKFGALKKVTFERIDYQDALSEDYGNLLSLPQMSLRDSPEDVGFLFALRMLGLKNERGKLPAHIGKLPDLKRFIIKAPDHLQAILWESLGKHSPSEEIPLAVETLQSLPESLWQLPSIRKVSVLASGETGNAEQATLRSLDDADGYSDRMSVLTVTDMDCHESLRLVEMPHGDLPDDKRPDVVLWTPDMVEDFIAEVHNSDETGYFVSKTWLFSLQEHEWEEVMLVLRKSGYIETYQTSTTMFYERMEDDVQVQNTCIDPAYPKDNIDISVEDTKQVIGSDDIDALDKIEETVFNGEEHDETFHSTRKKEPGYFKRHKTSTSSFEYTRGHAHNNPASQTETCHTEKSNIADDKERSNQAQRSGDFRPSDTQGSNRDVVGPNVTPASPKVDAKCLCPPELLTVSFTPPSESSESSSSSSSQGEYVSRHSVRKRGHDCHVKIPRRQDYNVSTGVDKDISMTTVQYNGASGWKEVLVSLNVRAETSLKCCLRRDLNNKRVRVELLKIRGAVKMNEPILDHVNTHALVLKAVRTNVHASLNNTEVIHLKGPLECIVLKEYTTSGDAGQSQFSPLLWLETSEEHPKNCETESTTLGLQCHVKNRLSADVEESGNKALVLDFPGNLPVNLEGEINGDPDSNSSLELDVRYETEISYIEPRNPLPLPNKPIGAFRRINRVVDYDCLLEIRAQRLSHDSSAR